jgi:nucleoid-associated protein YejK
LNLILLNEKIYPYEFISDVILTVPFAKLIIRLNHNEAVNINFNIVIKWFVENRKMSVMDLIHLYGYVMDEFIAFIKNRVDKKTIDSYIRNIHSKIGLEFKSYDSYEWVFK